MEKDCFFQNGRVLGDYVEGYLDLYNEACWGDETLKELFWNGMDDVLDQMLLGDHRPFAEFMDYTLWLWGHHLRLPSTFTITNSHLSARSRLESSFYPKVSRKAWESFRRRPDLEAQVHHGYRAWANDPQRIMCECCLPPRKPEPANTFVLELEPEADSILRPEPITRSNLESKLWNQSTQKPAKDLWLIKLLMEPAPTLVPAPENISSNLLDQ